MRINGWETFAWHEFARFETKRKAVTSMKHYRRMGMTVKLRRTDRRADSDMRWSVFELSRYFTCVDASGRTYYQPVRGK